MEEHETMARVVEAVEGSFYGKYRGTVRENRDSTGRGRLQVSVPSVMGDQLVWALPCVPYAGPNEGFFALPPVGAGVWIEFEGGDTSYPIWVGCYWKDREIPSADSSPSIKFLRTGAVTLRIDDDEGSIEITTSGGSSIKITGTEIVLEAQTITAKSGTKKSELTPTGFDLHDGAFTVV